MSQARIGRIRMKAGGAEVRVFKQETPNPAGENYAGLIVKHAREVAGYHGAEAQLVGYFVIGLFSNGRASTAWRLDPDKSPVPRKLFPAYVTELMRESMITQPAANNEAVDVFNNQWVPRK